MGTRITVLGAGFGGLGLCTLLSEEFGEARRALPASRR